MEKLNTYIEGINNEDYHADRDYVSSSQLKKAIDSHANYRYEMSKPRVETRWKKDNAMDFGSLVHCLLLEPEMLDKEFAFIDVEGRQFRSKEDKAYLARLLDLHKGKIILPNSAMPKAKICVESALSHPFFKKMLECSGEAEMSGYFQDDFYSIPQRFRPDRKLYDLDGLPAILDVKTTGYFDNFAKIAKWDLHYDLSAAMYVEGNKKVTGEADVPFYFGVVETVPPFRSAVYKASDRFLEAGFVKYRKALSNVNMANGLTEPMVRYQEVDYQEI